MEYYRTGFHPLANLEQMHDVISRASFGLLLALHLCLVELVFPHLPEARYGYILLIAVIEIVTLGLAYQVWLHLHASRKDEL